MFLEPSEVVKGVVGVLLVFRCRLKWWVWCVVLYLDILEGVCKKI